MHTHRVDVFDRADDDEVVCGVPHHFELELLPSDHRLFDQHLMYRTQFETASHHIPELVDVVGDTAPDTAHRERGPDDRREPCLLDQRERRRHRPGDAASGHFDADLLHRVAKEQTVFCNLDRLDRRTDEGRVELLERPLFGQRHGQIQRRLSADGRQHSIGTLLLDDLGHDLRCERFDVGTVGHDRRRIAVDQHDAKPL